MSSVKGTLGSTASGAAAGAMIGGVPGAIVGGAAGFILSLFDDGDDEAKAAAQQRLKLYQDLAHEYFGPDSAATQALNRLEELSKTGLSDEDRAAAYNLLDQSNTMARGREGAVRQEQAAQGRGVANSGLDAALQDQASQAAAQRQTQGEVGIAGVAAQRRAAALQAFLEQKTRNEQMLAQWKLAVTGGQAGALQNMQDAFERESDRDTQNLYHGLDAISLYGLQKMINPSVGATAETQHEADLSDASKSPAPVASSNMTTAPAYDYNPSGATTAGGAAQQYAGGPFALAQPRHIDKYGMYDLSPLIDQPYLQ